MAFVNRVIDGDTIEVRIGGHLFTVRYIGIDTPETVHPSRPVEPFGLDASERNKELVAGREVILEKDVSETDRFGRLLRYVWLDEVTLVNAILVSEGLAQVSTFPPDVKYTDQFLALQELARVNQIGLWGDAPVIVEATSTRVPPTAAATPRFVVPTQPAQNCDPSYPTVCIPPFPPDLDCGEIPYRRFAVRGSDPHGFDRDRDGIGCES